jgi:hypothetical protein
MDERYLDIINTAQNTEVLRPPKGLLATFGSTKIHYYVLTDPIYKGIIDNSDDTILREGFLTAERPRIITPYYMKNMFEGFEHGDEYSQSLQETFGAFDPGILYRYKNDSMEMSVITTPFDEVFQRINDDLEKEDDPYSTIIKGDRKLWDLSLMIFIYGFTGTSLQRNISDLHSRGLLTVDRSGVPKESRLYIESLFREVKGGSLDPAVLKKELDAWGIFGEYEDRFLDLFRKNR